MLFFAHEIGIIRCQFIQQELYLLPIAPVKQIIDKLFEAGIALRLQRCGQAAVDQQALLLQVYPIILLHEADQTVKIRIR